MEMNGSSVGSLPSPFLQLLYTPVSIKSVLSSVCRIDDTYILRHANLRITVFMIG